MRSGYLLPRALVVVRDDGCVSTWGTRRGVPRNVRERILSRDRGECQLAYLNHCSIIATEIDHIGDPHDDSDDNDDNLRAVCTPCHRVRTMQQSRVGSAASAARRRARLRLPERPHPGEP